MDRIPGEPRYPTRPAAHHGHWRSGPHPGIGLAPLGGNHRTHCLDFCAFHNSGG